MNGPEFSLSDGNKVGISALPVRDYYLRFSVYPRSSVKERSSIIEMQSSSLVTETSRVPSVDFLPNSTRIVVSFISDKGIGLQFAATEILPIREWTEVTLYIAGNTLTLVALNEINSFANRIQLPFSRNIVNSVFIYAGSTTISAASGLIQDIELCANDDIVTDRPTAAPTNLRTASPSVVPTAVPTAKATATPTLMPTLMPTLAPSQQPSASPTQQNTVVLTSITTSYVPAPTSQPTIYPTPGINIPDLPGIFPTLPQPLVEPSLYDEGDESEGFSSPELAYLNEYDYYYEV